MKKIKFLAILGLIAASGVLVSAGFESYTVKNPVELSSAVAKTALHLEPAAADGLIQGHPNDGDFVILDVRTPEEFAAGHLAEAINVNFNSPTFRQDIAQLDPQKTYLIYCRTGVRSHRALTTMQDLSFQHLHNLLGGIVRWQQAGFGVVR